LAKMKIAMWMKNFTATRCRMAMSSGPEKRATSFCRKSISDRAFIWMLVDDSFNDDLPPRRGHVKGDRSVTYSHEFNQIVFLLSE
jgi:hypothetical protein